MQPRRCLTVCVVGSSTLERFNQGAPKVKAMCGVSQQALYQGSFMFALKDTQTSNADEVVKEFGHKTETLLQEADNFLSTMYPAGVTIAAFPFLEDSAFYDALSEVEGILETFEPQFNSALQFASMSKTLIAKIAHKVMLRHMLALESHCMTAWRLHVRECGMPFHLTLPSRSRVSCCPLLGSVRCCSLFCRACPFGVYM